MEDLELEASTTHINFIPCVKWVKRGVAKTQPEKVKLTQEELCAVINQAKSDLKDIQDEEEDLDDEDDEEHRQDDQPEDKKSAKEDMARDENADFNKEYDLDNYDNDDDETHGGRLLGIGDIVSHANPRDDPYLQDPDRDEDDSDIEDMTIKPTDNLILAGHVEGNASILEVYVYNDVDDELYVHHDILLPSFPLALEWLSYEPGEDTKGSLVAVGTMNPIVEVWDLDLVDGLEPVFRLGSKNAKKTKKKKKKSSSEEILGHTDAVLSLAWNHHVEHVMASGSVDETVLLWDLSTGGVASALKAHKEKVQALQWHPFESQMLLTGCCDERARVFDCRADNSFRTWKVDGEVEKVHWNHFDPFTFLVATEKGYVHMVDCRQTEKPLWSLQAHEKGINGLAMSTQCPDCVVTVSTDETMKVWDIHNDKPTCVEERSMNLGRLHCLDQCPDAPFVVCMGGDKSSDNLRVFDIREANSVKHRFGDRKLQNPLKAADFGFSTINEAEPDGEMEQDEADPNQDGASALEKMSISSKSPGGAAGKFKKEKKKKKNKLKNF